MSKDKKEHVKIEPKPVDRPDNPDLIKVEGIKEAEALQKSGHRLIECYRVKRNGPKTYIFAKE